MLNKLLLYFHTVRYLRISQIYYRIKKMMNKKCTVNGISIHNVGCYRKVATIEELNYDPVFLARYSVKELLDNQVCFLNEKEPFSWNEPWFVPERSELWNFNLHYFDFLIALIWEYKKTKDRRVLEKTIESIRGWILQNPIEQGGNGWAAYTISLRLVNWITYYTELEDELDQEFKRELTGSIFEQCSYLTEHVEKDILGNHYFENLKTLIMCALFFCDENALRSYVKEFKRQCKEQILTDGMHFELSPMYHKVVLEGMLRVAYALRQAGYMDREIEEYLPKMLDVAFSMEHGLARLPLFNDCGGNVARSLSALLETAESKFGIKPIYRWSFPDSGYYIFEAAAWKLIVDAGQPGPRYIPGHAHCDAMSFELFYGGEPVVVNCGTYAYQCDERTFFRSTAAHNTVMVNNTEQSQCWSVFRLARRSRVDVVGVDDTSISMELHDYAGHSVCRTITLTEEKLSIVDSCEGCDLKSFIHGDNVRKYSLVGKGVVTQHLYSPDYGKKTAVKTIVVSGRDVIQFDMKIGVYQYGCNENL